MLEQSNLTDHFLIAMPALEDPNFSRTVTYIFAHGEAGAMGLVINRPLNIELGEVLEHMQINIEDTMAQHMPIYQGGPVQPERGFVLHQPPGTWDAMMTVSRNIGISTSRDILGSIAQGRGPGRALIALGYAGWGAGQLERELADNAWLNGPADMSIIFDIPADKRWEASAAKLGVDITLLSSQAGHA
ncbi:MAG: YqgE/AlgH family protein [Gammaproteobacteria bacterium]|nr:YqgE/AlgH family protein [Gammaproteobacteria bacterium]